MPYGKIKPFIKKLYDILGSAEFSEIIQWNSNDSFIIHDREKFCEEILRKFFKTSSFDSFTRQLNKYDFRKQRNQDIFWNNDFTKNNYDRLNKIVVKESYHTLRQIRDNGLGLSLFNCKVVKILTKIADMLENIAKNQKTTKKVPKILIFEDFDPSEMVEMLQCRGAKADVVFFYNDFEVKINSIEYDYLVIDSELFEIFNKISNVDSYRSKTKVICTSKFSPGKFSSDTMGNCIYKLLRKPYDGYQLCSLIK
ncbi:uncharacterized protein VICG_01746 [Vittaforma corneae ATCC 50505]|uniref:HSF-type DNA-binding domain-containing protein n=1 Tax=Vittaforma corneae (strain ATCC 50505) TaxID=993615 RepID=L2GLU1_VITCO|nr:uncharacterized protein VICG_01746 [Vittaforma corneae ATCC 50505]ELA41257.1 hypothetical protein VICG_01746 [Vittaforma corneae ATCC 50505]